MSLSIFYVNLFNGLPKEYKFTININCNLYIIYFFAHNKTDMEVVDLKEKIDYIKSSMNNNKDLIERYVVCASKNTIIFYLNEQANEIAIQKYIINPMQNTKISSFDEDTFIKKVISIGDAKLETDLNVAIEELSKGNTIILIEGFEKIVVCTTVAPQQRSVQEPPNSAVIYGPREGFVENIKTNLNLIRKRLPSPKLKIEEMDVGYYTKTKVMLCYMEDIADENIAKKIKERISKINIDGIIDSHYLVSFLEEKKGSIFKQIGKTEKPDIVVAKMLEGRIAIIVDNSPVVLTLPFVILEDLQNSDDYYQRSFRVGVVRFLRLIGLFMSILLPGVYVAIQLYHYRIIPLKFLVSIINSSQGIPFTPFVEMLFVIVLFEILFEASLRMPKYIGMALSIVGALVLGDTAVKAGLISSPAVMIIALTGISFYTIPDQTAQISVLRLLFTLLGGALGLLGMVIGGVMLITYLVEFNAYDTPYLSPYAPYIKNDIKDGIFKKETIALHTRPKSIPNQKIKRKSKGVE